MRGALEGAVKGGAYNIADVLDNRLRNAYNARKRQKLRTIRRRNTWNKKNKNPWNSRNPRPTGSRSPQSHCKRPKPLRGDAQSEAEKQQKPHIPHTSYTSR